ncbi:CPBP family intramembrane glutamic endopeptidase [Metabacillus arenae]|uniref:CPBP family intramembrane metalloprotease n=1 Tax=Metabacillus arenae TaxID=2771434 RepID=A0A926NPV0_9BACI|nr:type II CAAX endopeptidase family protein [Metabacillus arenae]MBD1381867.1 CPBP family intramembrane metalloprotease [Metabacillus arenae]
MYREKNLKLKEISIRIVAILILGIIIWNFISYISDTFMGQEYSPLMRLISALLTTVLTVTIVQLAIKFDKITWRQLGQSTVKTNIFSFLLGIFLWTIPASIGFFICLMLGWVEIKVHTDLNYLLLSILILFITVFLIEALPEELIFRGYIYRYLNAQFPHWGTIILQALLFSLFAYFIGAMYSVEQIQFIPGFAIILGVIRAISGSMWTSIGFHVVFMTATQILGPIHGHFDVSGIFTLKFFSFILLPSAVGATVLSFVYSNYKWSRKEPLN